MLSHKKKYLTNPHDFLTLNWIRDVNAEAEAEAVAKRYKIGYGSWPRRLTNGTAISKSIKSSIYS